MKVSRSDKRVPLSFPSVKISSCDIKGECGATLVFFENKATCFMDVRGGWAAFQTTLSNNSKNMIDGICIAGGSILGLEACAGVAAAAWDDGDGRMLDIEGAVIWSQNLRGRKGKKILYPTAELGRFAFENLSDFAYSGQVGAGTNARYGQGVISKNIDGYEFLCVVVNNAFGQVGVMQEAAVGLGEERKRRNTTITVLVTDMSLDAFEQKQLTHQLHASMAKTITPFNTFQDGDIFYLCSTQKMRAPRDNDLSSFFVTVETLIKDTILQSI